MIIHANTQPLDLPLLLCSPCLNAAVHHICDQKIMSFCYYTSQTHSQTSPYQNLGHAIANHWRGCGAFQVLLHYANHTMRFELNLSMKHTATNLVETAQEFSQAYRKGVLETLTINYFPLALIHTA